MGHTFALSLLIRPQHANYRLAGPSEAGCKSEIKSFCRKSYSSEVSLVYPEIMLQTLRRSVQSKHHLTFLSSLRIEIFLLLLSRIYTANGISRGEKYLLKSNKYWIQVPTEIQWNPMKHPMRCVAPTFLASAVLIFAVKVEGADSPVTLTNPSHMCSYILVCGEITLCILSSSDRSPLSTYIPAVFQRSGTRRTVTSCPNWTPVDGHRSYITRRANGSGSAAAGPPFASILAVGLSGVYSPHQAT